MTVGTYTYGTLLGVQAKAGWVVPAHAFSASTSPTDAQVENILDQIASQIHIRLAAVGYLVDTKANVTTNAPRAVKWLEDLNEAGAAADIIQLYGTAGDPTSQSNPSGYWKKKFEDGMKLLTGVALQRLGLTLTYESSAHLVSGSYLDTDGNVKNPFFRRDTFEASGASDLSDSEDV